MARFCLHEARGETSTIETDVRERAMAKNLRQNVEGHLPVLPTG
jgi:hypothetical protein